MSDEKIDYTPSREVEDILSILVFELFSSLHLLVHLFTGQAFSFRLNEMSTRRSKTPPFSVSIRRMSNCSLFGGVSFRAHTIRIGTIIFLYDKSSKHIKGVYQAISPPVFYVSKNPIHSPCIFVQIRTWYKFASLSLSSLPFSLHHHYRRVLSRKTALGIMSAFFEREKSVPYPVGSQACNH